MEAAGCPETFVTICQTIWTHFPGDNNLNIITDLINVLSGNSFVNTVQHATIEEAVFSVYPTKTPIDWLDSNHMICVSCDACPFRGYISKSPGGFRAVMSYK
jgi:hypothetical protein